ncbi:Tim44 domain-containing protein [Acetobacteraceae bacterium H6797]|nr:Tim44 domain-containing protein [Acetobacteraceae bacterium H6797]
MQGSFPVDLILFGMVAAFLVLRLRSVLGKRTGFERPQAPREAAPGHVVEGEAQEIAPMAARGVPNPSSPAGQALGRIRAADPSFEPAGFLQGATGAFGMIVEAFARGDRQTLKGLLSEDTYAGFEQAITAREQAGESQRTEIRNIAESSIEAADLRGTTAEVTVKFVSDQVNMTMARDGSVVAGTDAVTELTDIWTFQRDLRSSDPTWRLTATQSA